MWLFLVLVAVPIVEIGLFIEVGGALGLWPTLAIVVATALIGTMMIRVQGLATLEMLKEAVNRGENPSFPMAHGAMILVAGLLLLTPGFFTDTIGFLLLMPPVRKFLIKKGTARASMQFYASAANTSYAPQSDTTIDGDFEVLDEEDVQPGNSDWTKHP